MAKTLYRVWYNGQVLTDPVDLQTALKTAADENDQSYRTGYDPIAEVLPVFDWVEQTLIYRWFKWFEWLGQQRDQFRDQRNQFNRDQFNGDHDDQLIDADWYEDLEQCSPDYEPNPI